MDGKDKLNMRPIIGMPLHTRVKGEKWPLFINANYVKYLESAGARVALIPQYLPDETLKKLFSCLSGLFLPGGRSEFGDSAFMRQSKFFYDLALKANDAGDFFPIWGTCHGLEVLMIITAGEHVLEDCTAKNVSLPLLLTDDAKESNLFRDTPASVMNTLTKTDVTYNNHRFCITYDRYLNNEKMRDFYRVLSVNDDSAGTRFVSTIEARKYPIYAVQWHPERHAFEYDPSQDIDHTPEAIEMGQHFANMFVNETRKCTHTFPSREEENKYLVYNYTPEYAGIEANTTLEYYLRQE